MAQKDNVTGKLKDAILDNLEVIENASNKEVMETIKELKSDEKLWKKMPRGNKRFLENALDAYEKDPEKADNYAKGAVNHLTKALPFQIGHIAQKVKEKEGESYEGSDENLYQKVLAAGEDTSNLSGDELFELAYQIENGPEVDELKSYQGSRSAVQSMLGKYERLLDENPEEASEYAKEKSKSMRNIMEKNVIPNFVGHIADKYEKSAE
ncbi:MAG: hypothetical protein ABEJ02_01660 [Candidatus Paceibacteria bacterium]